MPSIPTPEPIPPFSSLIEALRWHAACHGQSPAYTFLRDGENEETSWTYAELDGHAREVAAGLRNAGAGGERAVLLYPSGLDFVAAFLGCLYAGVIAIPAQLPRVGRKQTRLESILMQARPKFVLTTAALREKWVLKEESAWLTPLRWLDTDTMEAGPTEPPLRLPAPESIAFLQYTSGSIAQPKGVMVSHRNLIANHRMLQAAFRQTQQSTIVLWLPLFHDMGLIGNVLQSLFLGAHAVLMAPEAFLVKPVRWLQAVTRYRAHTSGGPNFAFEHCARKVSAAQKRELDLSAWTVAFNGAEPIRAATLESFANAFAPCGFRPNALYPCYGLAEATLFVAGGVPAEPPVTASLSAAALSRGRAETPVNEQDLRFRVGCGYAWAGGSVKIVDPETCLECREDRVGEIWVAGPHVAEGYWEMPEATEETFGAKLAGSGESRYLRTGDLGFLRGGQLFITGRLKELIIIASRNHYPNDLEHTVENSHPNLVIGGSAAFSVEIEGEERLVILAEMERHLRAGDERATVERAIRHGISEEHGISVHALVLLLPGSLPKTSSGKIRRRGCLEAYTSNSLKSWQHPKAER